MKIPYESIAIEADRLMIRALVASNTEDSLYWSRQYKEFLEACGWTATEFDNEMIRRIDMAWEKIYRQAFPIVWN